MDACGVADNLFTDIGDADTEDGFLLKEFVAPLNPELHLPQTTLPHIQDTETTSLKLSPLIADLFQLLKVESVEDGFRADDVATVAGNKRAVEVLTIPDRTFPMVFSRFKRGGDKDGTASGWEEGIRTVLQRQW